MRSLWGKVRDKQFLKLLFSCYHVKCKRTAGSHFGIHTRKHCQNLPHIKLIWQSRAAMQNITTQHQQLSCCIQALNLELSLKIHK